MLAVCKVAEVMRRERQAWRRSGLGIDNVTVLFHTSEHDRGHSQRSVSAVVRLPEASNDSMVLVRAARF